MFKGNPKHTGNAADTFPLLLANPRFDEAGFAFDLQSEPGETYKIEYSDDLASIVWTQLTNAPVTAPSLLMVDPSAETIPSRYYRGRLE